MSQRISTIDPASAEGRTKELLDAVKAKLGRAPNLMRTLAHSPAALGGYLALSESLGSGVLTGRQREQIALAVAEANGCDYCLAAHSAIGKMAGLTPDEIARARTGAVADPKDRAILEFANDVLTTRGHVDDASLARAREAGVSDAELTEIVAAIALNVLTNYINSVAGTVVDFPKVPLAAASQA